MGSLASAASSTGVRRKGVGPVGERDCQEHLAESGVVKVLNDIYVSHLGSLQRPAGQPERSLLPIAGDAQAAKRSVTELID